MRLFSPNTKNVGKGWVLTNTNNEGMGLLCFWQWALLLHGSCRVKVGFVNFFVCLFIYFF
jgi:hypothetical protein